MRSTSELTQTQSSPTQRRAGAGTSQPSRTSSTTARKRVAVGGRQFAGKQRDRRRAGAMAREQQLRELGREGARRRASGRSAASSLVAAVGGVRDHAARFVEQALDLGPMCRWRRRRRRRCRPRPRGRRLAPSAIPRIWTAIGPALGESRRCACGSAVLRRRLHERRSRPIASPRRQRLADEQIDMRLQEAAGAELEDREAVTGLDLDQRLDHAGLRLDPFGKAGRRLVRARRDGWRAPRSARGHRASPRNTVNEILARRVAAAEQRHLARVEFGVGECDRVAARR